MVTGPPATDVEVAEGDIKGETVTDGEINGDTVTDGLTVGAREIAGETTGTVAGRTVTTLDQTTGGFNAV